MSAERSAESVRPRYGKWSHCPRAVRVTSKGKITRHKRLRGGREYGNGTVWCEGSGGAAPTLLARIRRAVGA